MCKDCNLGVIEYQYLRNTLRDVLSEKRNYEQQLESCSGGPDGKYIEEIKSKIKQTNEKLKLLESDLKKAEIEMLKDINMHSTPEAFSLKS